MKLALNQPAAPPIRCIIDVERRAVEWAYAHFFVGRFGITNNIMSDEAVARVTEIAERVGQPEGIEIVEVRLLGAGKQRVLRITIDKPAGVTTNDCEFISQQVGTILDVEDVIPGAGYTLEVSSPGVERPLLKPRDYERAVGKKAKVTLREPVEDRRQWVGVLAGISGDEVTLEPEPGRSIRFALHQVAKANLKFDW